MVIKEISYANEDLIKEVGELVSECNKQDGLNGSVSLDTSLNFNKDMNTIFLLYKDNKLVSALTLFVPSRKEGEVSAWTLPEYRGRGYFAELLKRAETELKRYNVPEILFVCEAEAAAGKAVIAKLKAKYEFTEYFLEYNHSLDKEIEGYCFRLKLDKAGSEALEAAIKISMASFNDTYEDAKSIVLSIINSDNRQLFLGRAEDEYVGIGAVCISDEGASINGLGVLPEQQGKGYGKEMLYCIMDSLIKRKVQNINLEVNSENENAFRLYRKSGFEIKNAWEYFRRTI